MQESNLRSRAPESCALSPELQARSSSVYPRCSRASSMAKKGWKRTTPEERARWLANHERLERALARWFRREGVARRSHRPAARRELVRLRWSGFRYWLALTERFSDRRP